MGVVVGKTEGERVDTRLLWVMVKLGMVDRAVYRELRGVCWDLIEARAGDACPGDAGCCCSDTPNKLS